MIQLLLAACLFSTSTFASMKHEHGVGELYLGVAGKKVAAIMTIPLESVVGFEYEPTKEKDLKTQKEKTLHFEDNFFEMVKLDNAFNCKIEKVQAQIKREKNHGEYTITASMICTKEIKATTIKINFKDNYPSIKKVHVNVVSETKNQSLGLLKGQGEIEIP